MRICFLEAPAGISLQAGKRMMERATAALDEAFHIPDVRIFLREYSPENVSQDGRIGAEPVRPVYFMELTLSGDRVAAIRDFRYVPYVVREAAIELAG